MKSGKRQIIEGIELPNQERIRTIRGKVWFGFGLVLWHINHFRLFNAKSIFMHVNSFISYNSD